MLLIRAFVVEDLGYDVIVRNKFLNFENAIGLGIIDRIYAAKTLLWNTKIFLDDFNNRVLYSFGKIFYILNSFGYIKETLQKMNFLLVNYLHHLLQIFHSALLVFSPL